MQKFLSMLVIGGVVSTTALPAFACGGGGGGCAMSGGGYYASAGGRALAGGKISGRAPMLAKATPGANRTQASAPVAALAAKKPAASPALRTVAAKTIVAAKAPAAFPIYTCPMHPQVQWTKPTECPVCGMKLKLKPAKADATKRAPAAGDEHAGMDMDETSGMNHEGMSGMDGMQMCPGCMMNMGDMSGTDDKQSPAASQKASGGTMRRAGMGCGC